MLDKYLIVKKFPKSILKIQTQITSLKSPVFEVVRVVVLIR